jgi:signal transduction histidine kinase
MSRLVRLFLFQSAVALAVIVVTMVLLHESESDRLVAFAESQNVALARSFANAIWPRMSSHIAASAGMDRKALLAEANKNQELEAAVRAISAGLPVVKIKIYNLKGLTLYSTNPAEIGEDMSKDPGFSQAARNGKPASKVTYRGAANSFEGTVQDRDVVESYIPLRRQDGTVAAVLELYTDVAPLIAGFRRSTTILKIGFLLVYGTLFGILFLFVYRADRTIAQQYADIVEKNAALKTARDELELRIDQRTKELSDEIAERRRAEDEARRHRDELAHSTRVGILGEMASTLAHELKQPLTVISGCAQLGKSTLRSANGSANGRLLDAMEQIAEQSDRANEVVQRVQDFARKKASKRKKLDINEVVRGVGHLLQTDARKHGATIELDLAESLPLVSADAIQIQQVVMILAHNGMEAMNGQASASSRLTIRTSPPRDGALEITVHDNGGGISAEDIDRIFDPYFTTKADGLGMGLSISRSIVEAHGGQLWATPRDGNGTVFHFTLPLPRRANSDGA